MCRLESIAFLLGSQRFLSKTEYPQDELETLLSKQRAAAAEAEEAAAAAGRAAEAAHRLEEERKTKELQRQQAAAAVEAAAKAAEAAQAGASFFLFFIFNVLHLSPIYINGARFCQSIQTICWHSGLLTLLWYISRWLM